MKKKIVISSLVVVLALAWVRPVQAQTVQLQAPDKQANLQVQSSSLQSGSNASSSTSAAALQPASSGKTYSQATRGLTVGSAQTQTATTDSVASPLLVFAAAAVALVAFAALGYFLSTRRHKHNKTYELPKEEPLEDEEIEEALEVDEKIVPVPEPHSKTQTKIKKAKKTKKTKAKSKKRH